MLTKGSIDHINSLIKKADIKSFITNPLIKQLYDSLNTSYEIVSLKNSNSSKTFPNSDFIHKSLYQKIEFQLQRHYLDRLLK